MILGNEPLIRFSCTRDRCLVMQCGRGILIATSGDVGSHKLNRSFAAGVSVNPEFDLGDFGPARVT